jgi:6-phosphogluconolactonase
LEGAILTGRKEILDDPDALAGRVAEWLTALALSGTGPLRVALSGGSTPAALYTRLASGDLRERFPWSRVHWYWGDERLVPREHPSSNYAMVDRAMLSKVRIPAENVHAMPVHGTPEAAARRYERALQEDYGDERLDPARPFFDVVLLGLGTDGHTASLLPGDPALEEERRWVVAVPHGRPEARITMTLPLLESSRRAAFLVAGAAKAAVLRAIEAGGCDAPAARLRPVGELHWFVDRQAAGGSAAPGQGRRPRLGQDETRGGLE